MPCSRGCCETQQEHYRSISIAPSATPTRSPRAADIKQADAAFERDGAAYRRLRADGLQPRTIEGAATLEAGADTKTDVEMGWVGVPRTHRGQVEEMAAVNREMGTPA